MTFHLILYPDDVNDPINLLKGRMCSCALIRFGTFSTVATLGPVLDTNDLILSRHALLAASLRPGVVLFEPKG